MIFFLRSMFWFLFSLAVIGSVANADPIAQNLSLDDCIRIAIDQSATVKESRETLASQALRRREAQHDLLPSAELSVTDNRIIDVEAFSFYDPQTGQRYVPGEGYQAAIGLDAPLYAGGRLRAGIKAATATYDSTDQSLLRLIRDVEMEVTTRYITLLERKAECNVRREQIIQAEEALKLAENRVAAGRGIRYEVLLEQAFISRSRVESLRAENAFHEAQRQLLLLLRMPIDTPLTIDDLTVSSDDLPDNASLISIAVQQREDARRLEADLTRRQSELDMLRSARKPSLNLFAQYQKQGESLSDFNADDDHWFGGLSFRFSPFPDSTASGSFTRERIGSADYMQRSAMSFRVFDGTSTRVNEADLRIAIHSIERDIEQLQDLIASEVLSAAERVRESAGECETADKELAAAIENHLIQAKSYELGLTQFKDLVDARTDEFSARIDVNFARYKYVLDRAVLDHATGTTGKAVE